MALGRSLGTELRTSNRNMHVVFENNTQHYLRSKRCCWVRFDNAAVPPVVLAAVVAASVVAAAVVVAPAIVLAAVPPVVIAAVVAANIVTASVAIRYMYVIMMTVIALKARRRTYAKRTQN